LLPRGEHLARRWRQQSAAAHSIRGKPAHGLLSIEQDQRVIGERQSVADLLALPRVKDVELPLPNNNEPAQAAGVD
jgi:hypothetical protein